MPRNRIFMAAAVAVVAVAAVGFGGWYFLIRGDEPPPVNLADAVAAASSATATGDSNTANTATPTTEATESATGSATASAEGATDGAAAGGDLSGTWTIDASNSETFVGYRIEEELAQIGSATAVGRTSDVTGTLEFDGTTITAVEVTADLSTLTSDDDRRDGQLQRQALESSTYPEATFALAEPITIEGDPASGEPITATAVGDLTIHGVTNRVELALEGQLTDAGQVVVVGSTPILLADYGIEQPESMMVLSVSDEATMEMQLIFVRA